MENTHTTSTREGSDWLTLATDPYHDFEVQLAGMPDGGTAKTFVTTARDSVTITQPAGVTGNWDCHIAAMPYSKCIPSDLVNSKGNGVVLGAKLGNLTVDDTVNPATGLPCGQIVAHAVAAGEGTFVLYTGSGTVAVPTDAAFSMDWAGDDTIGWQDGARLIGLGFEVTNTTAEIEMQGSVTVYGRSWNSVSTKLDIDSQDIYTNLTLDDATVFTGLPTSEGRAFNIPNSRQWKAAEGAYVPVPVNAYDNPITDATSNTIFTGSYKKGDVDEALLPGRVTSNMTMVSVGPTERVFDLAGRASPLVRMSRTDMRGTYFTGLSPGTSLVVTMKATVEVAPYMSSPFLPIASKPAKLDEQALAAYTKIVAGMPPGAPRAMNDQGDWFRMIKRVAQTVVRPVLNNVLGGGRAASSTTVTQAPTIKAVAKAIPKKKKKQ